MWLRCLPIHICLTMTVFALLTLHFFICIWWIKAILAKAGVSFPGFLNTISWVFLSSICFNLDLLVDIRSSERLSLLLFWQQFRFFLFKLCYLDLLLKFLRTHSWNIWIWTNHHYLLGLCRDVESPWEVLRRKLVGKGGF